MGKLLKYSVLRYSPSKVAGEKINLGILFCDMESDYKEFKYSKKFSRLSAFDDEIDIGMVKKLLQSISDDVSGNLFSYDEFDIEQYTKFFINDFTFEKPKLIEYDDLAEMVKKLHKTYFRFEYDKTERPSKEDDKVMIAKMILAEGKNVKRDKSLYGSCNEKITFDLVTDDYCIKIFDFDGKNLKKLVNSAKTWAWNAMQYDKYKLIIIYRYTEEESKYKDEFKIIMNIFNRSNTRVYDIEEGMRILQSAM